MNSRILSLFLVALLMSTASMAYELLLAQSLSTLLGNSVLRYSVTIGLYLAALGAGATLCAARPARPGVIRYDALLKIEIILAALGGGAPAIIFLCEYLLRRSVGTADGLGSWLLSFAVAHVWIIVIGMLSGYEVPLLLEVAEAETGRSIATEIIAVDFFGSFLGTVLVPLVLYPRYGIFGAAFVAGILNVVAAVILMVQFTPSRRLQAQARILVPALTAALVSLLVWRDTLVKLVDEMLF